MCCTWEHRCGPVGCGKSRSGRNQYQPTTKAMMITGITTFHLLVPESCVFIVVKTQAQSAQRHPKEVRLTSSFSQLTPDIVRARNFARGLPAESGSGGALLRDGLTDLAL